MLWLALACTPEPEPDADCPDTCGVTIVVEPPEGLPGTLWVRTDPPGVAFGGDLLDADGDVIAGIDGVSEAQIELLPGDLVTGERYTVALDHACEAGRWKPACASASVSFVAAAATTLPTTTTTDGSVTDTFVQGPSPEVDVLFVVDNSCSMSVVQDDLVASFPGFIDHFLGSGIDYHIGVVSTDMDDPTHSGRLRSVGGDRWIEPATPNPDAVFSSMALMGILGSGIEKGLGATFAALELEREGYNAGFLREASAIHVVVLTDERDQTHTNLITVTEFIDWFSVLRADPPDRTFSSIVMLAGIERGTAYIRVTEEVGGIVHDITDPYYGTVLDQLGVQASGLKREFFLSVVPLPDTLEVEVVDSGGAVLAFDQGDDYLFSGERNSVTFLSYVPEGGAQVVVRYLPAE